MQVMSRLPANRPLQPRLAPHHNLLLKFSPYKPLLGDVMFNPPVITEEGYKALRKSPLGTNLIRPYAAFLESIYANSTYDQVMNMLNEVTGQAPPSDTDSDSDSDTDSDVGVVAAAEVAAAAGAGAKASWADDSDSDSVSVSVSSDETESESETDSESEPLRSRYLTYGIYIPRHYEYLDTLYNVYCQISFCSTRVIGAGGIFDGEYYYKLTELVNALNVNKRMYVRGGGKIEGYSKLWAGKAGVIRREVLGKRTSNNARSVIVPDPDLQVDEVKLPLFFKDRLSVPFRWDSSHLATLVFDPSAFDDVTHVIYEGSRQAVKDWLYCYSQEETLTDLPVGTKVLRRLRIGDMVLVNRQPSLRLQNMLGVYVAKFGGADDHTIGINLALTKGLGADFDGDEMNVWVPQTPGGLADLLGPLSVERNRVDEATGESILSHAQDVSLGYFLRHHSPVPDDLSLKQCYDEQRLAYDLTTAAGFSLSLSELYAHDPQISSQSLAALREQMAFNTATALQVPEPTPPDPLCATGWETITTVARSKGSPRNLDQMTKSVGLQLVRDKPVRNVRCAGSVADGFITSSYLKGLTIGEYIQHCMAARESLIATAMLTGVSGYNGRRMCLAMADMPGKSCGSATSAVSASAAPARAAPARARPGLRAAILLGQRMTQETLSTFHSTGGRIQSTLNDTVALVTGRKGGSANKRICTWDTVGRGSEELYSFTNVDGVVEHGARNGGARYGGPSIATPIHVLEAYFIWFERKMSKVCEIDYQHRFVHDELMGVPTEHGLADLVRVVGLDTCELRLCGALHAGALHAGALHAGALHAGALHAGALHAGALHAGALHAGALVLCEKRSALARKFLRSVKVTFPFDEGFDAWFRKTTPDSLLKELYFAPPYTAETVVCSDPRLCEENASAAEGGAAQTEGGAAQTEGGAAQTEGGAGTAESRAGTAESRARRAVRFFLERSPLGSVREEHIGALVDTLFVAGRYSSITRHGDAYKRKTTIGRASIESNYAQMRLAISGEDASRTDDVKGCFSSELWMMGIL